MGVGVGAGVNLGVGVGVTVEIAVTVATATVSVANQSQQKTKKTKRPLSYSAVHRTNMRTVLTALHGQFVGVDFVKQDGSIRRLNGRLGVHSYLRGGLNTLEADSRPYLTVFDVKKLEYRSVNLETACSLRADRHVYSILG